MMALVVWIARVLVVLFLLRMVMRLLFGRGATPIRPQPRAKSVERAGGTLVRDPQCGTYIPQAGAISFGRGSEIRHFCSTACRDAWIAATARTDARAG